MYTTNQISCPFNVTYQETSVVHVPTELLNIIASDLPLPDYIAMGRVCKQWSKVIIKEVVDEKLLDYAIFGKKNGFKCRECQMLAMSRF